MNIGIVSTHPSSSGGVSSYTKNLMNSLKNEDISVILLSDCLKKYPSNKYIIPCWNQGIFYPSQIFKTILNNKIDLIHIQHEFFIFGGIISSLLFPTLLIFIKILRKPVVVTLHGVIPLSKIDQRFVKENELSGSPLLFRIGIKLLTMTIVLLSDVIIVHENLFAKLLVQNYRCLSSKIFIIPHGVEEVTTNITQTEAKEKLQLLDKVVILFFGYLAPYKGLKTLIEGFSIKASENPDWILIVGGGEHPRLKQKESYKRYVLELREKASYLASNRILFSGFIPNEKIPIFFTAADIIVFPYNLTMSSSGPFAKALSYGKPILVSSAELFIDIIPFKEIIFIKDSPTSLGDKLELIINDSSLRTIVSKWVKKVAKNNSWENIGRRTASLYYKLIKDG